jgi:hypothetical protein
MDKQYVSEKEYDVDNEPVFPVCGTCNARKEQPVYVENMPVINTPPLNKQPNLSKLLMDKEQISKLKIKYHPEASADVMFEDLINGIQIALLNHLAKLGNIYVKVERICDCCNGKGNHKINGSEIVCSGCLGSGMDYDYSPFADYLKEEE